MLRAEFLFGMLLPILFLSSGAWKAKQHYKVREYNLSLLLKQFIIHRKLFLLGEKTVKKKARD